MNKRRDIYLILGGIFLTITLTVYGFSHFYQALHQEKVIEDSAVLSLLQERMTITPEEASKQEETASILARVPLHFSHDEEVVVDNTVIANTEDLETNSEEQTEETTNESTDSEKSDTSEIEIKSDPIDPNALAFNDQFSSCTPSSYTVSSNAGTLQYGIVRETPSGCVLRLEYLEHTNPEWVNKDLLCVVPKDTPLVTAVDLAFSYARAGSSFCDGALVSVLQK